jgi:CRP-like cAMP-binding protein
MSLSERERQANKLIQQGDIDSAVKGIFDLVGDWAKEKDFEKADFWRAKLIEIDPMALAKHFDAGEIIESEKATAVDALHQNIWASLYNSLTKEEGKEFYANLQEREFPSGKIIIRQGKLNKALFFIDEGQLKNIISQGGKESFLHDIGPGDIAGQDTFFDVTVCSSTIVTVSSVKLKFIDRKSIDKIDKKFPGFSKNISKTCSWLEAKNPKSSAKIKPLERRQSQRHNTPGKVVLQTFDNEKNPIRPAYSGWMEDISTGGASFTIRCADKDVGRALLGRMTSLSVKFENGLERDFAGQIKDARFDLRSTYNIRLKYENQIPEGKLNEIIVGGSP